MTAYKLRQYLANPKQRQDLQCLWRVLTCSGPPHWCCLPGPCLALCHSWANSNLRLAMPSISCGQETTLKTSVGCSEWGFGSSVAAEFCEVRPGLPRATHSRFWPPQHRAQLGLEAWQCAWGQNAAQHWGVRVRVWGTAPGTARPEKEEEGHWWRHWSKASPAAYMGPAESGL